MVRNKLALDFSPVGKLVTYIYTLSDPRCPEVIRYVGKTVNPLRDRLSSHICEAKLRESKSYKNTWIRKLLKENTRPVIFKIATIYSDETTQDLWAKLEQKYILMYKDLRHPLTNLTLGGEGAPGIKMTEETKLKISAASKGRILSQEHKDKISSGNKGKTKGPRSEESKLKQSISNTGRKRSATWITKQKELMNTPKGKKLATDNLHNPESRIKAVASRVAYYRRREVEFLYYLCCIAYWRLIYLL